VAISASTSSRDLAAQRNRIDPALQGSKVEPLMRGDEIDHAGPSLAQYNPRSNNTSENSACSTALPHLIDLP